MASSGQQRPPMLTTNLPKSDIEPRFIPVTISSTNSSQSGGGNGTVSSQKGYTILVPANVRFRGVNMQLDLKIDQKTLAAASTISKVVQDAVNAQQYGPGDAQLLVGSDPEPRSPSSLSRSVRLNTGGRDPRDLLAEKLHKVKSRCSNGLTISRSAAPSPPDWTKNSSSMTPPTGSVVSSSTVSEPRSQSAHVLLGTPQNGIVERSELATLLDKSEPNDSSCLSSTVFPFIAPSPPSSSTDFMNLDETLDSVVRNAAQSTPSDWPIPTMLTSCPAKRTRRGDRITQSSHFCEFNDADGQQTCKQRAIISYRFCIRHILNDPFSPYMACQHVKKPKSRDNYVKCIDIGQFSAKRETNLQCTNAIRVDKMTPYCTTHMIMKGLMEAKSKKVTALQLRTETTDLSEHRPDQELLLTNGDGRSPGMSDDAASSSTPRSSCAPMTHSYPNSPLPSSFDSKLGTIPSPIPSPSSNWNQPIQSFSQQTSLPFSYSNFLISNIPDSNGYGPPPMASPLSGPSLGRSNSVTSLNSCPNSAITPGSFASPTPHSNNNNNNNNNSAQLLDLTTWKPPQEPSELMRQHPELTAKLMQTPRIDNCEDQTKTNAPTPIPPAPIPPTNLPLPTMAPIFHSRPVIIIPSDDQTVRKVIRLKQKRQRMRMLGNYRRVSAVTQMCKILEDADFDRTDLFPLGLEPSDSDTDTDLEDRDLQITDSCFADRMLRFGPDSLEDDQLENNDRDLRRRLYLVKKQLRLERHRLLRDARINAAVMHSAKRYPNSTGRALLDRRKPPANRLRIQIIRRELGVSKRNAACWSPGRPSQIVSGSRLCCRCSHICLPYSNHCSKHAVASVDQRLFRYCSESQCDSAVVDFGLESWQPGGGRCEKHRETRPDSSISGEEDEGGNKRGEEEKKGRRRPTRRLPCERRLKKRRKVPPLVMSEGDTASQDKHPVAPDGDVTLAAVIEDLGVDDTELTDMLDRFPVEGEYLESLIGHDFDKPPPVEPRPPIPSSQHQHQQQSLDVGHNWADVEQFLLSEGYQGSSFRPPVLPPPSYSTIIQSSWSCESG